MLTTVYSEKMNRNIPWGEYPRPSMVRADFLSLNGEWDFALASDGATPEYSEKILVPFPPESALSGISRSIDGSTIMYYKRSFTLPESFCGRRILLHFGAVDTLCEVYVNGALAVRHEGGYLPFRADITALVRAENEIVVKVRDELDQKYPYGKQTKARGGMWYTPVSGIWQSVWLEPVPEKYIERVKVTPTVKTVNFEVFGGADEKCITLKNSGESFSFTGRSVSFTPKEIKLWTPEEPNIYEYTLTSGEDTVDGYFAMREISVCECEGVPRLCLNGKPYLFNGLLDQGYYPDGIFLPATSDGYRDDILLAKSLGFNMLRKHIKIEPEIFYYLCDTLGIAVFQDMINNSDYSFIRDTALPTVGFIRRSDRFMHRNPESRRIFREQMHETIEHLYSFPSVLYYTIFNEGWGQFTADEVYREAKAHDPSRIYDATSGWFVRHESDVDSRHIYFRPVKVKKKSPRPIVISEFGGYSHRVAEHLFGDGNYGYSSYASAEEFEDAFVRLYEDEILPSIPLGVSALVYTQLSDVEDETNGLVTYDRRVVKVNRDRIRAIMRKICEKV